MEYLSDTDSDILLIEDNPHDAELIVKALRRGGLANRLLIFPDGVEALEWLFAPTAHTLPRVVLLDLKLPKMSGLEVLRQIKTDDRTRMLPVVVLTSSEHESDITASYELGANSYIVKPVDFDKFFQTVTELGSYWLLLNKAPFLSPGFL
jgi:CheY-like chemotaxis protein